MMQPATSANGSIDYSSSKYNSQLHSRARSMTTSSNGSKTDEHLGLQPRSSQQLYSSQNGGSVMHTSTNPLLRPAILLPDTVIYYAAIAIDILLRFTWSLKLSTHLHAIHEIEQGVFLLEALEVIRRWMWVFIRIEWEAVRKGQAGGYHDKLTEMPLQEQDGKS